LSRGNALEAFLDHHHHASWLRVDDTLRPKHTKVAADYLTHRADCVGESLVADVGDGPSFRRVPRDLT